MGTHTYIPHLIRNRAMSTCWFLIAWWRGVPIFLWNSYIWVPLFSTSWTQARCPLAAILRKSDTLLQWSCKPWQKSSSAMKVCPSVHVASNGDHPPVSKLGCNFGTQFFTITCHILPLDTVALFSVVISCFKNVKRHGRTYIVPQISFQEREKESQRESWTNLTFSPGGVLSFHSVCWWKPDTMLIHLGSVWHWPATCPFSINVLPCWGHSCWLLTKRHMWYGTFGRYEYFCLNFRIQWIRITVELKGINIRMDWNTYTMLHRKLRLLSADGTFHTFSTNANSTF